MWIVAPGMVADRACDPGISSYVWVSDIPFTARKLALEQQVSKLYQLANLQNGGSVQSDTVFL